MFTGAIFVPMFTIITLGPYTPSKQSETFPAKCNLKVNCENRMSLRRKSDCMSVTDLNHAVGHLCHVVDVCSNLQNNFMTIVFLACLINWLLLIEKLQKRNFALQHDH